MNQALCIYSGDCVKKATTGCMVLGGGGDLSSIRSTCSMLKFKVQKVCSADIVDDATYVLLPWETGVFSAVSFHIFITGYSSQAIWIINIYIRSRPLRRIPPVYTVGLVHQRETIAHNGSRANKRLMRIVLPQTARYISSARGFPHIYPLHPPQPAINSNQKPPTTTMHNTLHRRCTS